MHACMLEIKLSLYVMQKCTLKIPNLKSDYQLRGLVVYEKLTEKLGHYTAFFRSLKDPAKWFHANDGDVGCLFSS